MPALFSFEWRFLLTLLVEAAFALLVIWKLARTRRRRAAGLVGLLVAIALQGVAYDALWATTDGPWRARIGERAGGHVVVRYVEVRSPIVRFPRLRAVVVEKLPKSG